MSNPSNPRVFFDFSVDNGPARRVIFELFKDRVPITTENFRALCTGEKGYSTIAPETPLCYKGSPVHRIVPNFMIQGGDIIQQNGKSGESIYGGEFDDENFELACDREGLLVMANKGPNTNQSQWFITLAPAEHLTGKHVVFGRVQSGFEVVQEIGGLETDKKHRPLGGAEFVKIVHCGQLERKQKPRPEKAADDSHMNRTDSHHDRKRHSRSPSETSTTSQRSHSSSGSSESSDAARRRRRREKKEKKKSRKSHKSSKSKKLKFKEQTKEDDPSETEDPRAQEELALMTVELEHQQAERRRQEEEELVRLAEEKARKARALELLKNSQQRKEGGVIFKGRGTMRYRDDEVTFGKRAWKD